MKRIFLILLVLCGAPFLPSADGGLVVTFGPIADLGAPLPAADADAAFGPFAPGATVTLPVLAHLTAGSPDLFIDTITLPIDFLGDGYNVTGGPPPGTTTGDVGGIFEDITFVAGAFATNDFSVNSVNFPAAGNTFDFGMTLTGTTVTVTDNLLLPTKLFDLVFTVAATAPNGVFDIIYNPTGNTLSTTAFELSGSPIATTIAFDNGQIEVMGAAVPEPSTFGLMAMGCIGFGWHRRRKARQATV
jgi:hypothetical protein